MSQMKKETRNNIKISLIVIIGIIIFIISIAMNIIGMKQIINKEPDTTGMVGLSVRTSNSLGRKSNVKVDENGEISEESILTNALPIVQLVNNNWDRLDSKLTGYVVNDDGNLEFSDGYVAYCNQRYVTKVIFNENYKNTVIGRIKVGTGFKEIEKALGVPTFKSKEYLGYKTKDVYVFFEENEIVVYPNRKMSNKKLEELLNSYFDGSYGKGRARLLVDIRNNFNDIEIVLDEETNIVTITSVTRQFVAELGELGDMQITFYNGYSYALEATKDHAKKSDYLTDEDDLVELTEKERISVE